jgi:hypothetical protein
MTAPTITKIFGSNEDVARIIKNFDFSKVGMSNDTMDRTINLLCLDRWQGFSETGFSGVKVDPFVWLAH